MTMREVKRPVDSPLFADGLAKFWRTQNTAEKGNRPTSAPLELIVSLPFAEKKIGDVRYYAAMQADVKLTREIRVPFVPCIQPQGDIVTISDSSIQYQVSKVSRNSFTTPPSMDVTLEICKRPYLIEGADSDDNP